MIRVFEVKKLKKSYPSNNQVLISVVTRRKKH